MAMNPRLLKPTPAGFDPRRIAGLLLWSDASDQSRAFSDDAATTLAANDAGVAVLKSKIGPDLLQTVEANRPTYKTGLRANKAGLRYDGANDSMEFSTAITQVVGQHIFAAVNTASIGTGFRVFLERSAATGSLALYMAGGGGTNYRPYVQWGGVRASSAVDVRGPAVVRWHYNTSLTELQVNGGATQSGDPGSVLTTWTGVNNSTVQQSALDLYELLIYSSLTAAQIAVVNQYLMQRWSI